jgi:chemotaxis signal transduction protein
MKLSLSPTILFSVNPFFFSKPQVGSPKTFNIGKSSVSEVIRYATVSQVSPLESQVKGVLNLNSQLLCRASHYNVT